MLKRNEYLDIYRSTFNDFDNDFLNPSYAESISFDRGSGYFSLKSLVLSIDGLIKFIRNGGHIRLICNPELSSDDIELIAHGILLDEKRATNDLLNSYSLEEISSDDEIKMDIISNLIENGRLKIKIAFMNDGIYHEKFGIFTDKEDEMVYFNGSANETKSAKKKNFESFMVTESWESEKARRSILNEKEYFEKLWNNEIDDESLIVYDFPVALKEKIFKDYKVSPNIEEAIQKYELSKDTKKKELYPFQEKAINEFIDNDYKHFYEMATGTGKTFTSVKTIEKVLRREEKVFVIVCVPQIDLQTQWVNALSNEGFDNVLLFGGESDSKQTDENITTSMIHWFSQDESIICVSVYDTFFAKVYDKCESIDNLFLVFDEAHNLNFNQIKKLPKNARMKLGLSATVERFNAAEEKAIINYFTDGKIEPYYYGIEDAIENGFLSRYNYHPIYVRLSYEDYEKYDSKTKNIGKYLALKKDDNDHTYDDQINRLRNERSLILKQSSSKLDQLEEMIGEYNFRNSVVYCGQGKDEDDSIVDLVTSKLYSLGKYDVTQFTSKTKDRKRVLYEFEHDYYDTLVAIKCFDEGVDVPKLDKIYIMASDASMRQTVQRRGRVLRKCKETGKTIANIYDMVVLPPIGVYDVPHAMIIAEFGRAYEYARLAENKANIESKMNDYIAEYGVTKEEFNNEC